MARTILIRGAQVLPSVKGQAARTCDILVEGDTIAQMGPLGDAAADEVIDAAGMLLAPGLVNAHIHAWQYGLRGIGSNWVSSRDYAKNVHNGIAQYYRPEDNYVATLLCALAQINAGTTTIFDWCHNLRDSEMADASIDALQESGIRAVFGHGTAKGPSRPGETPFWELPHPYHEIRRLRSGRLSSDEALVTLAMAILGPDDAPYEIVRQNLRTALEFDLVASAHTWGRDGKRKTPDGMWRLAADGLLGPHHNISHGNNLPDEELKMIVDQGCSVSATPLTEMLNNNKGPLLQRLVRMGGLPSLGSDTDIYFNSSMLAVARDAFLHEREADNLRLCEQGKWPSAAPHETTTHDAITWATVGGARALRMENRIGSIEPGKKADLILVNARTPNTFPALFDGNAAHMLLMYAEASDVDTVMIGGQIRKRHGVLRFSREIHERLFGRLLASRAGLMQEAGFTPTTSA